MRTLPGVYDPLPAELAILTGKKWQTGRTIKVRFLDGSNSLRTKVENLAKQWEAHANLRLNFGNHVDADLRVAFAPGGSWSYLGHRCPQPAAERIDDELRLAQRCQF